jgi:hypothetical protein
VTSIELPAAAAAVEEHAAIGVWVGGWAFSPNFLRKTSSKWRILF